MNIDLNLLRVLDVMLEERSVTRTGARLNLTQSAVSHALNRLRHMLDDELFVRGPAGMSPTARAVEMGPQVHAALNQLQAALAPSDFDPRTSDRRFTIIAGAYACGVLCPALVGRLAEEAPLAELVISDMGPDMSDRLDARRADFLVGGVLGAPERFARETLMTEAVTWVMRAESPLARRNQVDLKALVSVPHVAVSRNAPDVAEDAGDPRGFVSHASWEDAGAFANALAAAGLTRRIGVTVPDTYSAIAVASRTDMATAVPRRLALLAASNGRTKLIDPPYPSPPMNVTLVYLKERLAEPAIAWLHGLIRNVAASL